MDKLDINLALRAFNRIREDGVERDSPAGVPEYHLGGIAASADFDGYTIEMHDDYVTLRIFFHNTFEIDYKRSSQLDGFIERLESIARKKSTRAGD